MWLALSMWIDCGAVPSTPELRLPPRDGPLAPSAIRFVGSGGALGDIATCSGCHPDQAAGWSTSAHAHASFDNPWYRASVEALRDEVGRPASRHCAGCHDPVLLATGAIEGEVDPADEAARIGVTCLVCHAVTEVTPDGNASLVVDLSDLPLPDPLEREGPRVEAHRARLRPAELASGAVCGACHRGFLDARTGNATFVSGLDDLGAHAASAYRGSRARRVEPAPVARADCVSCHFDGHRFLGGQTALATATGQVDAVTRRLAEAVTVYAHAWTDGSDLVVDAMVHNSGTGHTFPGGLADAQDSWLALEVEGADGERLVTIDDPADPRAHRVRAEVLDETGQPERQHRPHRIGLVAWDHRVAAGDARVFRTRVLGGAGASPTHRTAGSRSRSRGRTESGS
ncbi:MAG: multiheme c-type cytochrome [Myxococcota bacterium]